MIKGLFAPDFLKEWDESKHPRSSDGKFGEGSGSSPSDKPKIPDGKLRTMINHLNGAPWEAMGRALDSIRTETGGEDLVSASPAYTRNLFTAMRGSADWLMQTADEAVGFGAITREQADELSAPAREIKHHIGILSAGIGTKRILGLHSKLLRSRDKLHDIINAE